MRKNDIAVLVFIVSFTGLIGYGVGQLVFGGKTTQPVTVKAAKEIQTSVTPPSSTVFNSKAINPTVKITISDNTQNPIGN